MEAPTFTPPAFTPPAFTPNACQKILPPIWFFTGLAVMALIHNFYPTPLALMAAAKPVGWVIFACAFVMAMSAKRRFDKAGTPVKPFTESTLVVEAGLFRVSRNPMYLALNLGLAGFALAIGDAVPFVVVPAFFMMISTQFVTCEEQQMEARFGQRYLDYKSRVRRWL